MFNTREIFVDGYAETGSIFFEGGEFLRVVRGGWGILQVEPVDFNYPLSNPYKFKLTPRE
jgi:hypothetical protein